MPHADSLDADLVRDTLNVLLKFEQDIAAVERSVAESPARRNRPNSGQCSKTLENFLRALRAMDVRVSPAEAIDAHCTVDSVGYSDRTLLKDSLCIALAKSEEEVERFDECFDIFFTRDEFRDREEEDESEGLSDAENEMLGEQPLAEMLLGGSETEMAQAMEQAANEAGVANIRFSTQRGLFTRRILDRMGLRDLERLIASLNRQEGDEAAADMAGRLEQGRGYLFEEVRQYIDRQFDLYARNAGEELRGVSRQD